VLSDLGVEGGKVLGRKETFGEEGEDGSGTFTFFPGFLWGCPRNFLELTLLLLLASRYRSRRT
jgi:hypothetical protein